MKRGRRRWWIAAAGGCALLALAITVNSKRTGMLVDGEGKPIANAFVFFSYSAGTKLIWPWAHYDGLFTTRTGPDGRFSIPMRMHLRFPLVTLTSPVRAHFAVYVPWLHNACELGPDFADANSYCSRTDGRAGEIVLQIHDLGARPAPRFRTLWLLIYSGKTAAEGTAEQRRELAAAAREEYDRFLAEYGSTVFGNSHATWGHIEVRDWTRESGENRPWSFFLQQVPFYGVTMEKKLSLLEEQARR